MASTVAPLLLLAACTGAAVDETLVVGTTEPPTTTSTTLRPTTTTTETPTTTTTEPPTTTTSLVVTDELAVMVFAGTFEENRIDLAQLIEEGLFYIRSVDVLEYRPEGDTATLFMSATSEFPALLPEDLPEDGWEIMQLWKAYFEPFIKETSGVGRAVIPAISIELSGHTFGCPREFILDMIDLRVSQGDFVEICIP